MIASIVVGAGGDPSASCELDERKGPPLKDCIAVVSATEAALVTRGYQSADEGSDRVSMWVEKEGREATRLLGEKGPIPRQRSTTAQFHQKHSQI